MYTSAKTPTIVSNKLIDLIAALFILVFVYTATSKLMRLEHFETVLKTSPLIGGYARYVSVMLLVIELMTALLLFFPGTRMRGLELSVVLLVLFTIYISYMLVSGEHYPAPAAVSLEGYPGRSICSLILF